VLTRDPPWKVFLSYRVVVDRLFRSPKNKALCFAAYNFFTCFLVFEIAEPQSPSPAKMGAGLRLLRTRLNLKNSLRHLTSGLFLILQKRVIKLKIPAHVFDERHLFASLSFRVNE